MLIGRPAERITEERQTGTQSSYKKSPPSASHPCRKRYWQKVEGRDCQVASGNITHVSESKCEDESSYCRGNLRSRRKFPTPFHSKAKSPERFDRPLRQSVHATALCCERSRSLQSSFRRARHTRPS